MPDDDPAKIKCPNCGKAFRWKPEHAGKKVRCSGCEKVFRMPPGSSQGADDGEGQTYDLDMDRVESPSSQPQEPVPREKKPRCPSCGGSLRPGAVICVNCGYNLKEGRKLKTEIAEAGDSAADASGDDDADQPS